MRKAFILSALSLMIVAPPAMAQVDFSGVPANVRADIKRKCVGRYPDDYSMQRGCMNLQAGAYRDVHGDEAPAVGTSRAKPVNELTWCHANEPTARVLASANPNDLDPDYTGESYVGTGAALNPTRTFKKDGVRYIEGKLFSTRGGILEERMFALASEWTCDR